MALQPNNSLELVKQIGFARIESVKQYTRVATAIIKAQEEAKSSYDAQQELLSRLSDTVIQLLKTSDIHLRTPYSRPPTWKDAVLLALSNAPPTGMHVSDIWNAIQTMGVKVKRSRPDSDPLLMVDDALRRLSGRVTRVGRRTWALTDATGSPEDDTRSEQT